MSDNLFDDATVAAPTGDTPTTKKVELDLDDAPFLRQEAEAPKAPAVPAPTQPKVAPPVAEPNSSKKKRKMLIIGAAGLLVVLIAAAVVLIFFRSPVAPPPAQVAAPNIVVVPSTTSPVPVYKEIVKNLDPFWVENIDPQGRSHFLICSFAIVVEDTMTEQEVESKKLIIRDAIYFYLHSKTFEVLQDTERTVAMKKDIVDTINNYMSSGKVKDVLFDRYLKQ